MPSHTTRLQLYPYCTPPYPYILHTYPYYTHLPILHTYPYTTHLGTHTTTRVSTCSHPPISNGHLRTIQEPGSKTGKGAQPLAQFPLNSHPLYIYIQYIHVGHWNCTIDVTQGYLIDFSAGYVMYVFFWFLLRIGVQDRAWMGVYAGIARRAAATAIGREEAYKPGHHYRQVHETLSKTVRTPRLSSLSTKGRINLA